MTPRDDYDEPGGRAWDGWPWVVGGHVATALFVVIIAGFMAWMEWRNPADFWIIPAFGGFAAVTFVAASLDHDYRQRLATAAAIVTQDRNP